MIKKSKKFNKNWSKKQQKLAEKMIKNGQKNDKNWLKIQ